MNIVAFHSLMLDRGETLEYALESIERMSKQNPSSYYYDIMCAPHDIKRAGEYLGIITDKIRELNPTLADEDMHFGVTTNDSFRPAAMSLIVDSKGDIDVAWKDLNPSRRPR